MLAHVKNWKFFGIFYRHTNTNSVYQKMTIYYDFEHDNNI
jgi:hypothetical protein